ncbi:ABC transporter substrate-binding protein [uncultured Streptomyces sp.]|uniref:ABC transporter substrate-binding protein n=1 Tax=uncultured Streptomyces sp. TaxID=174707 RepID=UPI002619F8FA|nr:ABC transporter substrate-binding protein [uncultured Streptomyces sp.]
MHRKTLVPTTVAALLAAAPAGCGTPQDAADGAATVVVGTTDHVAATKDAPAPLDPAVAYEAGVWNVLRQTQQTLLHIPRGGGEPVPEAASGCRFTDHQNESYRCTLRTGLTFSDGTPLTPEDVAYSLRRVLAVKSPAGPAALLDNIDTIETRGEHEIVFHLRAPDATFPYKLATPAAGIVPRDSYPAASVREGLQVDGSGPYTMKAEARGGEVSRIVFTRNPRYKGDLEVRNEKVALDFFRDARQMGAALDDEKIDVMGRTLSPEQSEKLTEQPEEGVELTEIPGLAISYLAFDTDDPAVKNKAVRQAVAQLVDRDDISAEVYGSTTEPLYSLIPSGITGHTNAFFNTYGEPSVTKAADILRSAGISTPVRFTLHYAKDHYGAATATEFKALAKQLNDSGLFDVTARGTDWSTYRPAQMRGEYAVYGMGWFPDYPDPDNYTTPFLDAGNFLNSPYTSTETRTVLLPQTRREADRSATTAAFGRIQQIVATDVPVLPIWQGKSYLAARDGVTGVEWAFTASADLRLWELGAAPR